MANLTKSDCIFIHFSAPTLCGIKPSNLFTLSEAQFQEINIKEWDSKLKTQNLCITYFRISSTRWMIFVYDLFWIKKIISDELIQGYLHVKCYQNPMDTTLTLNDLFNRLKNLKPFPHEVGLFLGYPYEDVIGFEMNGGQNCKYCGYWKSYTNPLQAKSCCAQYKLCSQICKQLFDEGLSVPQVIKKYKEVAGNAA